MADVGDGSEGSGGVEAAAIEEVENEFVSLSGNLAAGQCRWLLLLAEIDARGTWRTSGFRSVAQWLSVRLGVTTRTARSHLAVARRLRDLPLLVSAFSEGRLSYSQVRAIARAIPTGPDAAREKSLVDLAGGCTADQLERICDALHGQTNQAALDAEAATGLQSTHDNARGLTTITLKLPTVDAARLLAAVDRRVAAEPAPPDRNVPLPPLARRRALALVDAAVTAVGEPKDRPAITFLVDLADYEAARGGTLNGRPVAQAIIDRYLDDASVSAVVFDADGRPVMAGTAMRRGDARTRRAVHARDKGLCQACGSTWRVEDHHVEYWDATRHTSAGGMVSLCRPDHGFHHAGQLTITKETDGTFTFTGPDGQPHAPARPHGSVHGLIAANQARGTDIDPASVGPHADGSRLYLPEITLPTSLPPDPAPVSTWPQSGTAVPPAPDTEALRQAAFADYDDDDTSDLVGPDGFMATPDPATAARLNPPPIRMCPDTPEPDDDLDEDDLLNLALLNLATIEQPPPGGTAVPPRQRQAS